MGRQLDPGDMQALHAELALVMALPVAGELELVIGQQAQGLVPQGAMGASQRQQLQIVVLAVAPHVLPGQLRLAALLPEGPADGSQQLDSKHFSHQRVPSVMYGLGRASRGKHGRTESGYTEANSRPMAWPRASLRSGSRSLASISLRRAGSVTSSAKT